MRAQNRRAPFQVLVLPYRAGRNGLRYAILRRKANTGGYWQFIAGGGHIGESRVQAARREAVEEAGVSSRARLVRLDARAMLPVEHVYGFRWGPDVLVIPEFCFGVQVGDAGIRLSREHTEFRWVSYKTAMRHLHWDSNRTALWELDLRLRRELDPATVEFRHPS
jgi:dATP pyrophosphohydrolase